MQYTASKKRYSAGKASAVLVVLASICIVSFSIGCGALPPPYVSKPLVAPPVVHCNDFVGHKPGSQPWIMGGTCTCTPSEALMTKLQADGFCTDMTAGGLRAMYEEKGIALRGPDHMWCNGLCSAGPHVVLGGKCMCPPTPGTEYSEKVIAGNNDLALDKTGHESGKM